MFKPMLMLPLCLLFPVLALGQTVVDPTMPLVFKKSETPKKVVVKKAKKVSATPKKSMQLQSILIAGEEKVATIDNQAYREGDLISRSIVYKISAGGVWIKHKKGQRYLSLFEEHKVLTQSSVTNEE